MIDLSKPLLAAYAWRHSEYLLLKMSSGCCRSSAPDRGVARSRVPKLCAHGGTRTRARRGSSPRVL
eukprot:5758233-Prymnesium_polylepis.1